MDNSNPPLIPPPMPGTVVAQSAALLPGNAPDDQAPIANLTSAFESILRQPRRVMYQLRQPTSGRLVGMLLVMAIVCSLLYGVVVGAFSGGMQYWAAPVKITLGLLLSACICLPSLYIFSCLSGAQARLMDILGLMAGMLCLVAVLLIGFAPIAWVFSQSTESVAAMGALHLLFGFVAVAFGLRFMSAGFTQLLAKSRAGLMVWVIIFVLVLLQMTTALRPIIGTSNTFIPAEKKFFLQHWGESMDSRTDLPSRTNAEADAHRR